jgi:hypothetical protein
MFDIRKGKIGESEFGKFETREQAEKELVANVCGGTMHWKKEKISCDHADCRQSSWCIGRDLLGIIFQELYLLIV